MLMSVTVYICPIIHNLASDITNKLNKYIICLMRRDEYESETKER